MTASLIFSSQIHFNIYLCLLFLFSFAQPSVITIRVIFSYLCKVDHRVPRITTTYWKPNYKDFYQVLMFLLLSYQMKNNL